MRKYKFYNSKGGNIIFTSGMDILSLDIIDLGMKMREQGNEYSDNGQLESGLGTIIVFGNKDQTFKAVNTFPEILESYINRNEQTYKGTNRAI